MFDRELKITVTSSELEDILVKNRKAHKTQLTEAREGYRLKAIEKVKETLKALESGKVVSLSFNLPVPQSYMREYTDTLCKVRMHNKPELELTDEQFEKFVLDRWTWKNSFNTTVSSYGGTVPVQEYDADDADGDADDDVDEPDDEIADIFDAPQKSGIILPHL